MKTYNESIIPSQNRSYYREITRLEKYVSTDKNEILLSAESLCKRLFDCIKACSDHPLRIIFD